MVNDSTPLLRVGAAAVMVAGVVTAGGVAVLPLGVGAAVMVLGAVTAGGAAVTVGGGAAVATSSS